MSLTRNFLGSIAAASVFAFTPLAQAAESHVHGGDIIVAVDQDTRKFIITSGEEQAGTGYKIFEGTFSTLTGVAPASNRWTTDDPGFDMEPGTLAQGDQLWVRGLGTLKSWNGSSWIAGVPNSEFIRLQDVLFESWVFRPTGVTATATVTGAIDEAPIDGQIHQHLDFFLLNTANDGANAGATVADGAYLIQLQLFSPTVASGGGLKYLDSDPFFIAFNRGLDDVAFESAVEVLAVPEPSAALMLLPALGIIAWRTRRQSIKS